MLDYKSGVVTSMAQPELGSHHLNFETEKNKILNTLFPMAKLVYFPIRMQFLNARHNKPGTKDKSNLSISLFAVPLKWGSMMNNGMQTYADAVLCVQTLWW